MNNPLYPLKFTPWLRTMVWGGEKIAPFKGVRTDQTKIGESWELSGVEGHLSVVSEGPLKGKDIKTLVSEYKGALVGEKVYADNGDEFPLLIKFIDAKENLSIQVHPNDEMAKRLYGENARGKTEMWYVIGADKGAFLLSGLSKQITPEEYERRVADNTITDVLARHEIAPGDVFFIPSGRIHAIGAGAFVAEIQQSSDYTYRIYDYGRLGLDGKPRELHTELAKQAIDYKVYNDYKLSPEENKDEENVIVNCRYFTTSLYDLDRAYRKDLSSLDSFLIVICFAGSGEVKVQMPDAEYDVPIRQGETVLVPACAKDIQFIPSAAGVKLLTSCIE